MGATLTAKWASGLATGGGNTEYQGLIPVPGDIWRIRSHTAVECERLQGFPDGHTDIPGASIAKRKKAVGNSMHVDVIRYFLQRVERAMA